MKAKYKGKAIGQELDLLYYDILLTWKHINKNPNTLDPALGEEGSFTGRISNTMTSSNSPTLTIIMNDGFPFEFNTEDYEVIAYPQTPKK